MPDANPNQVMDERPASPAGRRGRPLALPGFLALCLWLPLVLGGCGRPFDVNVGTKEPIVVDVNMDVHVYQHGDKKAADVAAETGAPAQSGEDFVEVSKRRTNRMEEVQTLKNNSFVGESHLGLLAIRQLPAGDVGDWVKKTVDAENNDRKFLMRHEASERDLDLAEVQRRWWQHHVRKSFKGEWVETIGEDPGQYQWVEKGEGPAGDEEEAKEEAGTESGGDAAAEWGNRRLYPDSGTVSRYQ